MGWLAVFSGSLQNKRIPSSPPAYPGGKEKSCGSSRRASSTKRLPRNWISPNAPSSFKWPDRQPAATPESQPAPRIGLAQRPGFDTRTVVPEVTAALGDRREPGTVRRSTCGVFDAPPPAAGEQLRALQPDVVVFDITTGSPVCAIRLWPGAGPSVTHWR